MFKNEKLIENALESAGSKVKKVLGYLDRTKAQHPDPKDWPLFKVEVVGMLGESSDGKVILAHALSRVINDDLDHGVLIERAIEKLRGDAVEAHQAILDQLNEARRLDGLPPVAPKPSTEQHAATVAKAASAAAQIVKAHQPSRGISNRNSG